MRTGPLPCALLVVFAVCGCVVVRPAGKETTDPAPRDARAEATSRATADQAPAAPTVDVSDLEPRVATARAKLAGDPAEAAKELAAVRAELLARWKKLESTQAPPEDKRRMRPDNPFYSDTLDRAGKALLASTFSLRAGLWTDQAKVDDAFRELVMPLISVSAVPCASDEPCKRARDAVAARYKGICFDFASSTCSPRLDDDDFALDKSKPALFARATVKKVLTRGQGVAVVTGDVPATDINVCKGTFETDKILDVNDKRILIERTTWCRSMQKERRTGWRVTHHLGKVPVKLEPGDHILVVADAKKIRRGKVGEVVTAESDSVLLAVTSIANDPKYRWNEVAE